jgi:3-oxoadipate enol-lactonase
MSGTTQRSAAWSGGERPPLPDGRRVWLPGRGHTFIRELVGPPGAPVVLLLHGWAATADLNWFACFEPLAEHFRVVALDHRGHGRGLRARSRFDLERAADDVAALAHVLGIGAYVVVGYSMGGAIAQLLWRRHPELIAALVLCATSTHFSASWRERLVFGAASGTSAMAGAVPVGVLTGTAWATWCRWHTLRRRPWWGFAEVARHDWLRIVEAAREIGRFDSRAWIGDVPIPTVVLATEDDDVVPLARQLALAAAIPHATVHRVAGGHAACTASPDVFAAQLVAACIEVAGARTARRPVPAAAA